MNYHIKLLLERQSQQQDLTSPRGVDESSEQFIVTRVVLFWQWEEPLVGQSLQYFLQVTSVMSEANNII